MAQKGFHLKGLNGIRAIAALSVVLSHTFIGLDNFGIKKIEGGWDFASYGVTMFFTLSGFLITYLLLKEKANFKTVSIKDFYVRRVLRIWPLYYFYLILVVIILLLNFPGTLPGGLPYYLFLGANIASALGLSLPLLTHYWSLGVEEQFYLFWPWLVKLFNPLKSITIFIALFLSIKLLLRISMPQSLLYQFVYGTRFDCMAIGALWSILLAGSNTSGFVNLVFNRITQVLSWGILLLAATGKFKIPDFINHDVFSVATANIILNVAFNKNTLIGLENKVFDFLGKISFGIYVYHVMIIYLLGLLLRGRMNFIEGPVRLILLLAIILISTITVAWLSYEFFEKPFLKFKNKFAKIQSHS